MDLEGNGEKDEITAGCEEGVEDDDLEQPQHRCWVCSTIVETGFRVSKDFYHIDCFKCCKCKRLLDITDFIPSHGKLYCGKHFERVLLKKSLKREDISIPALPNSSTSNAPLVTCEGCGYGVQDGVCVYENLYHPDCLKCDTCKQPVDFKHYKIMDGKIYCPKDYSKMEKSFAALILEPRHPKDKTNKRTHKVEHKLSVDEPCVACVVCNKPMIQGVYVQDAYYHVRCFRCARCRVFLRLDRYEILNGKTYCLRDYGKALAKETPVGEKPEVQGEPKNLLQNIDQCGVCCQCYCAVKVGWYIKGGIYHAPCLKCATCQDILLLSECKELGGEIYCLQDYKKIVSPNSFKHPQRKKSSSNPTNSAKADGLTQNIIDAV
ncbi:unnamed protein product [Calicophoron daubneyi]|uniref:LIM zinc-binding domain-containing protein n=1 Tax=Calicophoron daubneyi TaxID=300641 RepID=A0AAV2TPT0_CALDB